MRIVQQEAMPQLKLASFPATKQTLGDLLFPCLNIHQARKQNTRGIAFTTEEDKSHKQTNHKTAGLSDVSRLEPATL